jgi:hypothetical protein
VTVGQVHGRAKGKYSALGRGTSVPLRAFKQRAHASYSITFTQLLSRRRYSTDDDPGALPRRSPPDPAQGNSIERLVTRGHGDESASLPRPCPAEKKPDLLSPARVTPPREQ